MAVSSTYMRMTGLFLLLLPCYIPQNYSQNNVNTADRIAYSDSLLKLCNDIYYTSPDSSLYYANLILAYAQQHKLEIQTAQAWHAIARTEVLRGDIEQALQHLKSGIAIFEKYQQKKSIAKSYSLMSTAMSKIKNNTDRISYLERSVAIYRELKDRAGLTLTLVNLSFAYSTIKNYNKALDALKESKLYTEAGSDEWFYYYVNAGMIHMGQKNYQSALTDFDSCITISRRFKMVDAEVTALTHMAEALLATKKYAEALSYFSLALQMSRTNHLPLEESDILTDLLNYYELSGDYKNAFSCQNRLKVISDSLFNIEKIKNINTVEARLKVSEKEKTIALQQLNMEQNAAEQEKNKQRITLLITGSVLLALILSFTLYVYNKVRKQKREVELQKNRAEKLNSLNQKIFAVIAHDFKSPMITLQMLMDLLDKENISREDLSIYSADVRNQITQSGQILDNLLNWAKTELNLSQALHLKSNPAAIAREIVKELHVMCTGKNIQIINDVPDHKFLQVPPDIVKIILRNLLSNAVKFSYTNSVIKCGIDHSNAFFVEDTGAGINQSIMNKLFNGTIQSKLGTFNETGFGLGLHITHELIMKFNGRIWVENNYPSGTVFKFALPPHE